MPTSTLVELCEAGSFSIVRFRDDIADFSHRADDVFDELTRIVSDNNCLKLAIDLAETRYLPSSALGVFVRLHNQGTEVHLVNASDEVSEVIRVTRLDTMLHVNEIELGDRSGSSTADTEHTHVALDAYFVPCTECGEELTVDKHQLGQPLKCHGCDAKVFVTADVLQDAPFISAKCPDCGHHLRVRHELIRQPVECRHCNAHIEIRTIA